MWTTQEQLELQQHLKRRGEKGGVLGLQNEIIVLVRPEYLHHRLATDVFLQTPVDQFAEVALPFAVIVIDIYHRNARFFGTPLQFRQAFRHRQDIPLYLLRPLELQVVDDIDEEQGDGTLVRHHSV